MKLALITYLDLNSGKNQRGKTSEAQSEYLKFRLDLDVLKSWHLSILVEVFEH